jgi:hypothetical protein
VFGKNISPLQFVVDSFASTRCCHANTDSASREKNEKRNIVQNDTGANNNAHHCHHAVGSAVADLALSRESIASTQLSATRKGCYAREAADLVAKTAAVPVESDDDGSCEW